MSGDGGAGFTPGVKAGDSLFQTLGPSVQVQGSNGRPSFTTLAAMPDNDIHVQPPEQKSVTNSFAMTSIGNLPAPASSRPAFVPGPGYNANANNTLKA